jgi:hypothetical protein
MFVDKSLEMLKNINTQEELIISNYIPKFSTVVQTPYDWAIDKIQKFQNDLGISTCEIISVNNVVFVFGPLNIEPIKDDPETYKYKCFKTYAVFKKDIN